jgi:ribosomal protein S27E
MRNTWTAHKRAVAYEIECPACNETIPAPNDGSLFWTVDEMTLKPHSKIECPTCKREWLKPQPWGRA